jgi:hypothetical protein
VQTIVDFTRLAAEQVKTLRGRELKAFKEFYEELKQKGCRALGYRLSGGPPADRLCCRHLNDQMRAIVAFHRDGLETVATIVLVGPHDEDPDRDVYTRLWALCDLDGPPDGPRKKPACCGDDGLPPEDAALVQDLADRAVRLARRSRR